MCLLARPQPPVSPAAPQPCCYQRIVRLQLAELAEKLEKPRLAMTWYRAALGLDPEQQRALRALQRLLRQNEPTGGVPGQGKS